MKAIVTGGNRGIGLAVARQLVAAGFEVHSLARTGLAEPLAGVTAWQADLADYEATLAIVERIGAVDVLINNAGIMQARTPNDYPADAIQNLLQINLITAVRISALLAARMAAGGGGRIVSVASIAGEIGHPDIWYGISKAGLVNAMRALARQYGACGVLANAVAPGPVETDMMHSIPEERKARLKAGTITQRFCQADEVADVVCWLATAAPAYLNGEVVDLNNGMNYR
jgi:3-oxoacyl-[acyl-carrier protein] reductase